MCLISEHHLSNLLLLIWEKKEYKILMCFNWEGRVLIYNSQTLPQTLNPPMWDKWLCQKVNTIWYWDIDINGNWDGQNKKGP